MASNSNPFASNIRKAHLFIDRIFASLEKMKPQHAQEAAIQAHVLSLKAQELARKLKATDYLTGPMISHPAHISKKHKNAVKKSKRRTRR